MHNTTRRSWQSRVWIRNGMIAIEGRTIAADALLIQHKLARYLMEEQDANDHCMIKANQCMLLEDLSISRICPKLPRHHRLEWRRRPQSNSIGYQNWIVDDHKLFTIQSVGVLPISSSYYPSAVEHRLGRENGYFVKYFIRSFQLLPSLFRLYGLITRYLESI